MPSEFYIQILNKSTKEVACTWEPGGAAERELERNLLYRIEAKGVGLGRSTDHVIEDVRAALRELLYDIKSQVRP